MYDMIYLLTAIGLSPGGSTHLHTNNTWINTNNNWTTQIRTIVEECGPCPVFASFTLAFVLQLRIKHGETSVRVRKTLSQVKKNLRVQYIYYQKHTHAHAHTHTRACAHMRACAHTHAHTPTCVCTHPRARAHTHTHTHMHTHAHMHTHTHTRARARVREWIPCYLCHLNLRLL